MGKAVTRVEWVLSGVALLALSAAIASTIWVQSVFSSWAGFGSGPPPVEFTVAQLVAQLSGAAVPVALAIPAALLFARATRWERMYLSTGSGIDTGLTNGQGRPLD